MADDHQRRGLVADITRRLALAAHDELRVVDKLLVALEHHRFSWRKHVPTGPYDYDPNWHLAARGDHAVVTSCGGRWSTSDADETSDAPPVTARCPACQRAAWLGSNLGPLIAAVLDQLAAEDRERADLREVARVELDLGGEG